MSRRINTVTIAVAILFAGHPLQAAAPELNVEVTGLEVAAQSVAGSAIFLFSVAGKVDGRSRHGFGWVSVKHDPLPEEVSCSSNINSGQGTILVGFRAYHVDVTGGQLILIDDKETPEFDDAFQVIMNVDVCRRRMCREHAFEGILDHGPFPPTIAGPLSTLK